MNEILNVLTRKTSLRKACKELELADMEKLAVTLAELIAEREEEEAAQLAEQRERNEKLAALKKQIAESGFDLEELVQSLEPSAAPKKARGAVQPKYQITDAEGTVHKWTGRGRTPKVFQVYFDQGGSKDDCLIK